MMKKPIIILFASVLVAGVMFGAAAYWLGMQAEHSYQAVLQGASQWGFIKLSNESYRRGIFSSKARTIVEFENPGSVKQEAPKAPLLRFALAHEIKHGPLTLGGGPKGKWHPQAVLGVVETTISPTLEMQNSLQEVFGKSFDLSSIKAFTAVYFGGGGDSQLIIPAFQHTVQNKENVSIKWEGLVGELSFTAGLKAFKGSLSAPGLNAVIDSVRSKSP